MWDTVDLWRDQGGVSCYKACAAKELVSHQQLTCRHILVVAVRSISNAYGQSAFPYKHTNVAGYIVIAGDLTLAQHESNKALLNVPG